MKKQVHTLSDTKRDTFIIPKVIELRSLPDSLKPLVKTLRMMPRPIVSMVPKKICNSYPITDSKAELRKLRLEQPLNISLPLLQDTQGEVIKDSLGNPFVLGNGGISNFTNFTTIDGLALDAINCSKMDRLGNLWFGTFGGGVSRYDGKSFTTYTTANGLPSSGITDICEDNVGNLWFATDGGVSKYDGRFFMSFTSAQGLAGNSVSKVCEDKTGKIWFTTHDGVSCYTGKCFINFTTVQGLVDNHVNCICEDKKGSLWFGTSRGGISRYDGNIPSNLCNVNKCNHNLRFQSDVTEHNKQIKRMFTSFTMAQGLSNNTIICVCEDKKGNIWFGTDGGGVIRYNGNLVANRCNSNKCGHNLLDLNDLITHNRKVANSFVTFTINEGLADNNVRSILEDKNGNLWFGTDHGGMSRYDGKIFTSFTTAQGLAKNAVSSVVEDKKGNIWFSTYGGGVSRYNGASFSTFSVAQGLASNQINSIAEDSMGKLWFATNAQGVSCFDGKSFTNFSMANGLPSNVILSAIKDRSGNLWFGAYNGGVSRYDGKSFTNFSVSQGLSGKTVTSICEDKSGNLWFGTNGNGVSFYDGKSFTNYSKAQGTTNKLVCSIYEDRVGNIWFSTLGEGVICFNGRSFVTYTTAQGLSNNNVFSICQDKTGNIWFATADGLSVIRKEIADTLNSISDFSKFKPAEFFLRFTKKNGLPDNYVTQVLQLPKGEVAIGTNLGIALFNPSANYRELENLEVFNFLTGYPVHDVNVFQKCLYSDSKGVIWAGTGSEKSCLVRFDPAALLKSSIPPTVVIKSVKVNDENMCWYDLLKGDKDIFQNEGKIGMSVQTVTPGHVTEEVNSLGNALTEIERDSFKHRFEDVKIDGVTRFYPIPENLRLPYSCNNITIDFNAIDPASPAFVNYQYVLDGYDHKWSPIGKKTTASFGNIHEGIYIFKVRAQDPNGLWSAPVTFSFRVLAPWYRTWWAYSFYILSFLLALRLFSKWRERSLQSDKDNLEKVVAERTAEIVSEKKTVEVQKAVIENEKQRSDQLLLNILPKEVAEELMLSGRSSAQYFENVTVLFTDFVGFTTASERMSPQELVHELHTCFKAFDEIVGKYNVEKIKTVGDSYLAVAGLPIANSNHAEEMVKVALEIRDFMADRYRIYGDKTFMVRVGVHSGSVVAGIVGVKKFSYDIWGDTVNTAARMEQSSEPGKINISQATYELVKDIINCEYRGEINAKGKGQLKMYYVL